MGLGPGTLGHPVLPQTLSLKGQDEPFLYGRDRKVEGGIDPLGNTEPGTRTRLADSAAAQGQDPGGVRPIKGTGQDMGNLGNLKT